MNLIVQNLNSSATTADLRRRSISRRVRASESLTQIISELAFPVNADQADRRPKLADFVIGGAS